jgi:hypothetical protein
MRCSRKFGFLILIGRQYWAFVLLLYEPWQYFQLSALSANNIIHLLQEIGPLRLEDFPQH